MSTIIQTRFINGVPYDYYADGSMAINGVKQGATQPAQSTPTPSSGPTPEENDLAQFGISPSSQGGDSTDDYGDPIDGGQDFSAPSGQPASYSPTYSQPSFGGGGSFGGGNSYGLPTVRGSAGGATSGNAGPVNYGSGGGGGGGGAMGGSTSSGQSARSINDAATLASLRASSGGGDGGSNGTFGGSRSIVAGPVPDVGQMAQPFMGGPPGFGKGGAVGAGAMPTAMRDIYANFIKDPSSMESNPMYKSMMQAGLQAAERRARGRGFSGSGNLLTELQNRGAAIAGQFLPSMANMYQSAASNEANRWGMENQGNLAAGQFGLNQWQAAANDQLNRASANYGAGQDQTAMIRNLQTQQQFQPLMQQMLLRGY